MKKNYITPNVQPSLLMIPIQLLTTSTPFDGNSLNGKSFYEDGDASNAASRGSSFWDEDI